MNMAATSPSDHGGTLLDDTYTPEGRRPMRHQVPLLREYWAIIVRQKWVVAAIVALALLAGLAFTLLATPQYTAVTRIEISRQQQQITNVEAVDEADRTFDAEFYDTQYELLRTRPVAERVARELRLATRPEFFAAHGLDESNTPFLESNGGTSSREDIDQREAAAVDLLLSHVSINPVARSALVDIAYTSADPAISAQIANNWAEQFIAESIDRRYESTAEARKFLERRLAELLRDVEASERKLVTYANENNIVVLEQVEQDGKTVRSPTLASRNLSAMNEALNTATAERYLAESRANNGSGADTSNNQSIATLRSRRAELQTQYAQLMVRFEPAYPAARALQEQIAIVDQAIAREESRVRGGAQEEFRAALEREQNLRARVDTLTDQLRNQERARIQYNLYQNEVDTNRALYEGVLQRYREIGVASVAASNISIVDQAQIPSSPSSPNLPINMLIALFAGFALASVAVFALEQLDEGIRDPSDITPTTGLPLLGAIPSNDEESEDINDVIRDPKSDLSEAYFTVRSNLAMSTSHGVPRSFMVTSSRPAEGKSTSSYALANVLARTGKQVILVDADMRSPSAHGMFGTTNERGFSDFLTGNDDIAQLVKETDVANLSLMTAGRTPPSAAELLSTDRASLMVQKLLERYDHVVVDAPPMLGLADAPLLSRALEGVIYVIEARGVPARGINISLERLYDSNAHLLGAIMTKFSGKDSSQYGYGYGYGYGLSYGRHDEQVD